MSSQTLENDPREEKEVTIFGKPIKLVRKSCPNCKPSKRDWYLPNWMNPQDPSKAKYGVHRISVKPDTDTIDHINNTDFRIFDAENPKGRKLSKEPIKSLEDIVSLVVALRNGDYPDQDAFRNNTDFVNEDVFGTVAQPAKYLIVAEWFDLWDNSRNQKGKNKLWKANFV